MRKPNPKTNLDQFEEEIIRKTIYTFADIYKRLPTIKCVFDKLKRTSGIDFDGKLSLFRRVVCKLRFHWGKTSDNRKTLMKKTDIRMKRVDFLRKMKMYRSEGSNIIYTGETYLHSRLIMSRSWDDGKYFCVKAPVAKGQRWIIVHAGGEKGFVQNHLLIFKSGLKTGNYHDEINHINYTKWLNEKLIPNLLKNSVIVVDNASHRYNGEVTYVFLEKR